MLIDIHAHLTDDKYLNEVQDVILRAKEFGLERIVTCGSDYQSSKKAVELANNNDIVYAVIGVHPEDVAYFNSEVESFLRDNSKNEKVIAIGEIGLDYHYEGFNKELQKEVFLKQLKLASEVGLPVVIHSRDATGDMLEILKSNKNLLSNGGIMHCFSGSVETLREVINLGLSVSFGGAITFKNSRNAKELILNVPTNKFVLETDCPYLCPEPFRGQRNEPKNVCLVAKKVAEILELSEEEVADITTQNAKNIFKKLKWNYGKD